MLKKKLAFLKSPYAIFGGILIGAIIGVISKPLANTLAPWGEIYIRFLEMLIIPIIITAIISSIGKLLKSEARGRYLNKLVFTIIFSLLFASILGIFLSTATGPGRNLSLESRIGLGKIITKYQKGIIEIVPEDTITVMKKPDEKKESVFGFLTKLVPSNIFNALSQGENVKILFFAIIFGVALGMVASEYSNMLVGITASIFEALEEIISVVLYLLPFALICLIAKQSADTGTTVLGILIKYVISYFGILFALFFIFMVLMWRMVKIRFIDTFLAFREAILVAFGSANVYVALPSALSVLKTKMKLDKNTVNLVLPIGISIFPFASACFFAFNTVFLAQIFDVSLGLQGYAILWIGSLLAGIGSVGAPVLIKLAMFSIILVPLKIPLGPGIIVLTAIKPITESFEEVLDLCSSLILTTFIAKKENSKTLE